MSSVDNPMSRGEKSPLISTRRPTTNSDKGDFEAAESVEEYGTTLDDDTEAEVAGAPIDDRIEYVRDDVVVLKQKADRTDIHRIKEFGT